MKSFTFIILGFIAGASFTALAVYTYELKLHNEKEEQNLALTILHEGNYWEPISVAPYGIGRGHRWSLLITHGRRVLEIKTYTPWEREDKKASVHISNNFHSEDWEEIKENSTDEQKLIEILQSLNYQEHQEIFQDTVNEFIETLLDRSKFVYEPHEVEIEPVVVYPLRSQKEYENHCYQHPPFSTHPDCTC